MYENIFSFDPCYLVIPVLQCDSLTQATWQRVKQSEHYLRIKNTNLSLKLTNDVEEQTTKREVLQTYQETLPFFD